MSTSDRPFISICIPQYSRTSFVLYALRVLAEQTFVDFEVCISDDCSPDGRSEELVSALNTLGLRHQYVFQPINLRYDANLRACLSLAQGEYCLLMGNDDCLADKHSLARIAQLLRAHSNVGVAITNYQDFPDGPVARRVPQTRLLPGSPDLAASTFRNFSFVSGVVLRRDRAHTHSTVLWDGAEMYQMYLGSRILAEGFALLEIAEVLILRGIQLRGESVDSYATRPPVNPCPICERTIPLVRMGTLVHGALRTSAGRRHSYLGLLVFIQILIFTYPFWLIEYRRVQSWNFALGICLGMRPRNSFLPSHLFAHHNILLTMLYVLTSVLGLTVPIALFDTLQPKLYKLAKAFR